MDDLVLLILLWAAELNLTDERYPDKPKK